eukprot:TRINITY_DN32370_c0_g1_i1.p1 TRINITY_DN32370_c0_g1~~TRINITY_DN32370_c0_g1_i1.p1  ORF type:complete len:1394 (+),score=196.78 TRINITY_DN32370_c0_g1_i1:583-4182(+)
MYPGTNKLHSHNGSSPELDFLVLCRHILYPCEFFSIGESFSLSEHERPPDCMPLEDIAVRMVHAFGDLSTAFDLPAKSGRPSQPRHQSLTHLGSARSLSPPRSASPRRPPGATQRRVTDIGSSLRQMVASDTARSAAQPSLRTKSPGGANKSFESSLCLSEKQWIHALRGSARHKLLTDSEAKAEAMRQAAWQSKRMAMADDSAMSAEEELVSLFPNLNERLCIARSGFRPYEAVIIRVSTAAYGFLGQRLIQRKMTNDEYLNYLAMPSAARHAGESICGSNPFLVVLPLGVENDIQPGMEIYSLHHVEVMVPLGPRPRNSQTASVTFRAPGRSDSAGEQGLWAVQLIASEDGVTALARLGPALPFRVLSCLPAPPSQPQCLTKGTSQVGCFLTVSWDLPLDDGGSPVLGNELCIWLGKHHRKGLEPLKVFNGEDVRPPFQLDGLELSTEYVVQVRCYTDVGKSSWSLSSRPLCTPDPVPRDLGRPDVLDVGHSSATVRWFTSNVHIDGYEILIEPHSTGEEAWLVSVEPPQPEPEAASGIVPRRRGSSSTTRTEATVGSLVPRQIYTFRVRGLNASGVGPWSEASEDVHTGLEGPVVSSAPSAPVQVEMLKAGMTLAWEAPKRDGGSAIVRYFVKGRREQKLSRSRLSHLEGDSDEEARPRDGEEDERLEFQTQDASTRLTIEGLRGNAWYVFWVHALSTAGLSPPSPTSAFLLTGSVAPGPPLQLRVTETSQRQLSLAWRRPADDGGLLVDRYLLEVVNAEAKSERFRFEFSGGNVEGLAHGLQGNTNYMLRLRAETAAGTSAAAELAARTGPLPPGVPGLPRLLKDASATSATLAWSVPAKDGGSAILGYSLIGRVWGQGENGEADVYCTLDVDVPRGTVDGLEPDCIYRFCVCARSAVGPGPQSDWSPLVRTAPAPPLVPPAPCAVSASSQTVELTWGEALGDAAAPSLHCWEVAVLRAEEFHQQPLRVVRARSPPVAIRGLEFFTAYKFRVRVRGPGGWSPWSAASEPVETSEEWTDEEIVDHLMCFFGGSLASIFRVFDANCDGFVSELDLARGLDAAGLDTLSQERKQRLFADLDEGGRGLVTLREFTKCLSRAAAVAPSRSQSPRLTFRGDSSPVRSPADARRQGSCSNIRSVSPAGSRTLPPPGPGRSLSPPLPSRPLRKAALASPKRFCRTPSSSTQLPSPRLQSRERR